MVTVNHYDVLGVPRNASQQAIDGGYARAMEALRALVEAGTPDPARFDAVLAAYTVLRDAGSRRQYDETLSPSVNPPPPLAAKPEAAADGGAPQRLEFRFTGEGGEYFRIWIVNLLLSVLTLGIYSAWAKVRREKYFHSHTLLDGAGFDYLGSPKAILKGRALALGMFMLLSVTEKIGPVAHWVALLCLIPAVPWLVVRALRFRTHNTTYRGLRFGFGGNYRQALTTFVGHGLLMGVTLGLAFPLFLQRQKTFVLGNLRYGTADFACDVTAREFYGIFLKPILAVVAVAIVIGSLVAVGGATAAVFLPVLIVGAILALQILFFPYIRVRTTNAVWNHARVAGGDFQSDMTLRAYLGIVVTNVIFMVLTLGFYWPWAAVRVARYRADCLSLLTNQSMDEFVAGETARASALGDEVSELFDVDVAL